MILTHKDQAHPRAADIIAHAQNLVGTPFVPQGRVMGVGLDCIGVVYEVARHIGCVLDVPDDYSLSSPQGRAMEAALAGYHFKRRPVGPVAGDIVVMQGPARRQHLGVWTGEAIVHAHAGLRYVVLAPPHPDWPIISSWQLPQGQ